MRTLARPEFDSAMVGLARLPRRGNAIDRFLSLPSGLLSTEYDNMPNRTDVEGTLARWFAVDAIGQLGAFTGAYAAWPGVVFDAYSIVGFADEFLAAAPPVTRGVPTARHRELIRMRLPSALWGHPPTPDFALFEASQGLFSFDAGFGHGGSTIYFLDAFPEVPLLLAEAHPAVQRAARLVTFDRVRFSAVDAIDLAEHVPFVVGNR